MKRRHSPGWGSTDSEKGWFEAENGPREQAAENSHFPKLTNWPDKCEGYCDRLIPEMITSPAYKSGKQVGRTIPKTLPPSLTVLMDPLRCLHALRDAPVQTA